MTIQDLGNIGELVAAVATVATLLYLALQLRENTQAVRGEARRASRASSSSVNLSIATLPGVADLFNLGLGDFDALSAEDHTKFAFLIGELVNTVVVTHDEVEAGILDRSHLTVSGETIRPFPRSPGGRSWWARYSPTYPRLFREWIDDMLLEPPGKPPQQQCAAADSA